MKRALLLLLITLAACSKVRHAGPENAAGNVATAPVTAAPPAKPKLAQIFTQEIIGANPRYLETITGPAFKTEGSDSTYKVDGCTVIVGVSHGKIANVGIVGYGGGCSFDVGSYFAQGYPTPIPRVPTFADLANDYGGRFTSTCLADCGNAADPEVSLEYDGSHADDFHQLLATITVADEPVLTAWRKWGDALKARSGQDYMNKQKYNCGDNLADIAHAGFGPLKPTTSRVGLNLISHAECD